MIISIASGKGGTGKTTVATNMAVSLERDVQILDCDVEEPNAHLFIRPTIEKVKTITTPVPEVDMEKCNLCGKCGEICQFKAIVVIAETVLPFHELCHSCGGCMEVCPEKAITETGRELGVIEMGHRYTRHDILTIIDAPPGTSCPVIASMTGADFILLVTEPTPFGLHDLELAVGAVKILGIPCGLVINRSDMGDDKVMAYAEQEDLPILMEIPFDRRIAEAYSRGEMIVEVMPEWKDRFTTLYHKIREILTSNNSGRM